MTTIYAGQKVTLRARAADVVTGHLISDAAAVAYIFQPGLDPENMPADRDVPDDTVIMAWDKPARYYLGDLVTTGYMAGDWTVQVVIAGGSSGVSSWQFFKLDVKV